MCLRAPKGQSGNREREREEIPTVPFHRLNFLFEAAGSIISTFFA
jgi:hypothetical protein